MARQIIVLEVNQGTAGYKAIKVVFWFAIAAAKQYPKPTFQSSVDAVLAGGGAVSQGELAQLQSGALLEEVQVLNFASTYTALEIKAELQRLYTDRAAAVAVLPNPISFYGVSFDGLVWSA